MRQRVAIAIAIACSPKLVIADEPTTALDVTTQSQILALLRQLADQRQIGILLITHNLGVVANVADYTTVMYGGRTVEVSNVYDAFEHPYHPYTQALISSAPTLGAVSKTTVGIPGSPPNPSRPEPGCPFAPRCTFVEPDCLVTPPKLFSDDDGHEYACLHPCEYHEATIG
jgi:oligopeptide/dipeptide ABC transporter ATP-binding protein